MLHVFGARAHNLKNIDVEIPLDMMVAVTGVSGSGKSTLVHEVIYKALAATLGKQQSGSTAEDGEDKIAKLRCRRIERAELLSDVCLSTSRRSDVRPARIRSPTSRHLTSIREVFASTPEAGRRGYTAGHFSFNIPGGRCEVCQGDGTVTVEMQFLADVELICEECKGTRYKSSILEVNTKASTSTKCCS